MKKEEKPQTQHIQVQWTYINVFFSQKVLAGQSTNTHTLLEVVQISGSFVKSKFSFYLFSSCWLFYMWVIFQPTCDSIRPTQNVMILIKSLWMMMMMIELILFHMFDLMLYQTEWEECLLCLDPVCGHRDVNLRIENI